MQKHSNPWHFFRSNYLQRQRWLKRRTQTRSTQPKTGMIKPKMTPRIFSTVGFSRIAVTRTKISTIQLTTGMRRRMIWTSLDCLLNQLIKTNTSKFQKHYMSNYLKGIVWILQFESFIQYSFFKFLSLFNIKWRETKLNKEKDILPIRKLLKIYRRSKSK